MIHILLESISFEIIIAVIITFIDASNDISDNYVRLVDIIFGSIVLMIYLTYIVRIFYIVRQIKIKITNAEDE